MDPKSLKPQTPFDSKIVPQKLQLMKLLLPYMSSSIQSLFGIFIKFQELQYTVQYFQDTKSNAFMHIANAGQFSFSEIAEEFIPYLDARQSETLSSLLNVFQIMELMQNMPGESFMQNMLSPEQQEMFEFYSNMFSQDIENAYDDNNKTSEKESFSYGKVDESS